MDRLADAIAQAVIHGAADTEFAAAKINLALHVVGRRADGYHLLDSLVVFADFGDMVSVVPGTGIEGVSIEGPFADELSLVARGAANLVSAAAEALGATASKRKRRSSGLTITKRIPLAAGFGGGSADAAATLRLLNRHWKLRRPDAEMAEIAVGLGADVPMCLASRPVVVNGIGEALRPLAGMPPLPLVLVHPAIPLSTAQVFARLENKYQAPLPPLPGPFASVISFVQWLRETRNDLTEPAKAETGLAAAAVKALSRDKDCLFARMSGSGAGAFGIFASRQAAERAAERLRAAHPHWWTMPAVTGGS
ncbi:MAG: 4-(cytidine 5'-diphospho)-2-C-methyl-D-erythritol kinase [Bauldia sp.]